MKTSTIEEIEAEMKQNRSKSSFGSRRDNLAKKILPFVKWGGGVILIILGTSLIKIDFTNIQQLIGCFVLVFSGLWLSTRGKK